MIKNAKISMHQINTVTGDLTGNSKKIKDCLKMDSNTNIDISVFPETAITGYMCGSLFDKIDFIKNQLDKLNEIFEYYKILKIKGVVIIGYVSFHGSFKIFII